VRPEGLGKIKIFTSSGLEHGTYELKLYIVRDAVLKQGSGSCMTQSSDTRQYGTRHEGAATNFWKRNITVEAPVHAGFQKFGLIV
jgi:hypothetical protein